MIFRCDPVFFVPMEFEMILSNIKLYFGKRWYINIKQIVLN